MEPTFSRPPRLINVQNLRIQRIPSPNTPYAILSHTWGDEEVAFSDWQKDGIEAREGYQKIFGACLQARQDGIEYLWADTCCIDKRDNNELSEAINSVLVAPPPTYASILTPCR